MLSSLTVSFPRVASSCPSFLTFCLQFWLKKMWPAAYQNCKHEVKSLMCIMFSPPLIYYKRGMSLFENYTSWHVNIFISMLKQQWKLSIWMIEGAGVESNPFLKANKRDGARREATDRTVHPMLHLTPPGQPPTLADAPMVANQPQQTSFPTVATSPISYPTVLLPSVLPPIQWSKHTNQSCSTPTNPFSSFCLAACTLC